MSRIRAVACFALSITMLSITAPWSRQLATAQRRPVETTPAETAPADTTPSDSHVEDSESPAESTSGREAEEFSVSANVQAAPERREVSASSTVPRVLMEERIVRSTPDALRFEPGVSVQQTAHGQASPYVRGLTGQQVVHLFDGIRLNNGIYRQGPNQYFFTVDSDTVQSLEVVRGSASVVYGSDALGGAILAEPSGPELEYAPDGLTIRPRVKLRLATADASVGGRVEASATLNQQTGVLLGVGLRDSLRLESGGPIESNGIRPLVPRFEADGRTQLGTGYRELTFDARVVRRISELTVTGAFYGYQQFDAPRTDQCPPPEAPERECLTIREQFRHLGYLALRGDLDQEFEDVEVTFSYQRQDEVRDRNRPDSRVRLDFRDSVDTLGVGFKASTRTFEDAWAFRIRYGFDLYRDAVDSEASQTFTDLGRVFTYSRGEYLAGSSYFSSGAFLTTEVSPFPWITVRGGARAAWMLADAPADEESGTAVINRSFGTVVGRGAVEVRPLTEVDWTVAINLDQGFRAPNLDDLTSRQQTGPGFQFENPALDSERSLTTELGTALRTRSLDLDAWGFMTLIDDAIIRAPRSAADCPVGTPGCNASRTQFQLVNAPGEARIFGAEGGITLYLPYRITLRATVAVAVGDSPNPSSPGTGRVPLSRIPPLSGTFEARYRHLRSGIYGAAALRWADEQSRLALSDLSDARIPSGGTPGYAAVDLRLGVRVETYLRVALVFENIFDAAYRVHGSSINGPGRGLLLSIDLAP